MKKIVVLSLLVFSVVSIASAEMLTTANPIGQGKWAFLGAYIKDSNRQGGGLTNLDLTTLGGYVGYGVTDKLDAFLQLGQATTGGLPTGIEITAQGYGLLGKYQILSEKDMPVSAAIGAGGKAVSKKTKVGGGETTKNGNQMLIGLGVSKMFIPFVPYGALVYKKDTEEGKDVSTQIDIVIGTAIAWSASGAVLVEYTSQSITPNGGSTYTSSQIAGAVAYKI